MKNIVLVSLAVFCLLGSPNFASAQVDPTNLNTVLYADEFLGVDGSGAATLDPAAYNGRNLDTDGYVEAAPGETFTIHMIVNGYYLDGWPQFGSYRTAFWYDSNITERGVENRTWTDYYTFQWPIYVTNNFEYTMIDRYEWGGSQYSFYAGQDIVSWDFTVLDTAAIGATMAIGLEARFWMAAMAGGYEDTNAASNYNGLTLKIVAGPAAPGELDGVDGINGDDIDLMGEHIRTSVAPNAANYDLTADGLTQGTDGFVDILDLDYLVRSLMDTTMGVGTGTEYGDFNLDGLVDTTDLTRLATYFGPGTLWAEGNANPQVDLMIDTTDLTILGTYFGFDASADAIPEPMTLFVMGCGAIGLLRRRRRA